MSASTTVKPRIKARDSRDWINAMPIMTLVVLLGVMAIGSPRILRPSSLIGLLEQSSTLLVMGLGQTFVILLGSIDLTIAAVAAFSTIVVAMLIPSLGYGAFVVGALVGVFSGLATGLIHTKFRVPSFIATLGISGIWTGIAFVSSNATPITISNADIHYLCLLYTSPSPRDRTRSRMPSSA